jgi:hypothetical protein
MNAMQPKEQSNISIVRRIIRQELAECGRVAEVYVVGEIRRNVDRVRLFNKAIAKGRAINNSTENVRRGAMAIYRDAINAMVRRGEVSVSEGWITAEAPVLDYVI